MFGEPAASIRPADLPGRLPDLLHPGRLGNADFADLDRRRLSGSPDATDVRSREQLRRVWSPDGSRIAFQTDRKHQADLYVRPASGAGAEEALSDEEGQRFPQDWSRDGRFILYTDREAAGGRLMQISVLPLHGDRKPFTLIPRNPNDIGFKFGCRPTAGGFPTTWTSPVGTRSTSSRFPDGQGKVQISSAGGTNSRVGARRPGDRLYRVRRQGDVRRDRRQPRPACRLAEAALRAPRGRGLRLGRFAGWRAVPRERADRPELLDAAVRGPPLDGRPQEVDAGPVRGTRVTLPAGTRLGPYEILAPLGAGGMGEVSRCA